MMELGLLASSIAALSMIGSSPALAQEPKPRDAFQKRVLPIIERYCVDCHSQDDAEAWIVLDRFEGQASAVEDGRTWLRVRDAPEGHIMPPKGEPRPSSEELDLPIGWIEDDFMAARRGKQAGSAPVVIRRLNRQEYDNTIRDLLGVDLRLADAFPPDDIGFGLDNIGSALDISPPMAALEFIAAEKDANAVIGIDLDYTEFSGNRIAPIINGTLVKLAPVGARGTQAANKPDLEA